MLATLVVLVLAAPLPPPPTAVLAVARTPQAESCPTRDALAARVAARLGRDPFVDHAERVAEVVFQRPTPGPPALYAADITLHEANGRRGTRRLTDRACAPLAESVALALALAIDPLAVRAPETPSAALPVPHPRRPAEAFARAGERLLEMPSPSAPRVASPITASLTREGPARAVGPEAGLPASLTREGPARAVGPEAGLPASVSVPITLAVGEAPGAALGLAVAGDVGGSDWRAGLGGEVRIGVPAAVSVTEVTVVRLELRAHGCWRSGAWALCGDLAYARWLATAKKALAAAVTTWRDAFLVGVGVSFDLTRLLRVELGADVPLTAPPSVELDGATAWRGWPIVPRLGLGLVFSL